MSFPNTSRHVVAICLVAAGAVACLGATAWVGTSMLRGQARVDESQGQQDGLQDVQASLAEVEGRLRGYLLTRDTADLEAARQAQSAQEAAIAVLRPQARQDGWNAGLSTLRSLGRQRRIDVDRALAGAAAGNPDAARDLVRSAASRGATQELRLAMIDMAAAQARALQARREAQAAAIPGALAGAGALGAVAASLVAALLAGRRRNRAVHRAAAGRVSDKVQVMEREADAHADEVERSSRELHLSQAHLAGIIDAASAAILTVDSDHKVVIANQAAARLFGTARDDLIGASLGDLIPHRFQPDRAHGLRLSGAGDAPPRAMASMRDVMARRANGDAFTIDAAVSFLRSGEREWFTVVLQDMTERRRAETALMATRWMLEAALASMNDAVYIADTDGSPRDLNHAFATFHRFANREECLRAFARQPDLIEVRHLDGQPVPADQWVVPRALRGETASNAQFRLRRLDSGEAWIGSFNFAPIRDVGGAIVGAVAIGRDITEFRASQAELEHSRGELRLLIAAQDRIQDEERRRIARELHDDLLQTLAAICIDAMEIHERAAGEGAGIVPLVAELERLARTAIVSSRRILNDLRPEALEALGLVAALTALAHQFADRSGTRCTVDIPDDVSAVLDDQPALAACLYRATQEALNNVAKHARASAVHVSLAQVAPELFRLSVRDNGIGMDHTTSRAPQSFGLLGMAERVRAVGGQLRIDGNTDGGTTIEVLAPMPRAQAAPANGATGPFHKASSEPIDIAAAGRQRQVELDRSLQAVIDALDASVGVLDRSGAIRIVNRSWRECAERDGHAGEPDGQVESTYLERCRERAKHDPALLPLAHGLGDVLDGRREHFTCDYPRDTPEGRQWFRTHVASAAGGLVIVNHVHLGSGIREAMLDGDRGTTRRSAAHRTRHDDAR